MKTRFIVVLLGMLIPSISFAGVPNADFMNFATNIVENIQTKLSGIQNALQVSTIQSTLSKMGSAKASISDFINKQKNAIMEYKEKMDNYISQAKVYMEKAKAFKEAAEKIKEEGLGEYLKNNAGDLAGKVGLDGDKIQNAVNTVDGAVQGVKEDGLGGYLKNNAGDIAGKVGLDGDKIQNTVNTVDGAVQGVKEDGLGGYLKNNAGDIADKVGLDGDKVQGAVGKIEDAATTLKKDGVKGIVNDAANAAGIDTDKVNAVVNKVQSGVAATSSAVGGAKSEVATSAKGKLVDVPTATPIRQALEGFSTPVSSVKADTTVGTTSKTDVQSAAKGMPLVNNDTSVAKTGGVDIKSAAKALPLANNNVAVAKTSGADVKSAAKALPLANNVAVAKTSGANVKPTAKASPVAKAVAPTSDLKIKSNIQSATKILDKSKVNIDKAVEIKEKKDNKADLDNVKKINNSQGITPKRTQFKTSFGYGEMQNKYQLSFAILGGDSGTKTGTTPEGLLVVPDSISLNCNNLNYEDAIKDKKMDDCLRKMNDIASSEVTEEITKGKIDDAFRDIYNGYVEYLTSAYFEAFEIYNDSLTFKNNEVDPIITTSTSDIDGSWRVAKEMHIVLGSRFNKLHRLWSRALGMKMYTKYANEKLTSDLK